MITRYVALGALVLNVGLGAAFFLQREALTFTRDALATCEAYKEQTNEVRDATSNLPTAVDDILDRLRDLAAGQGGGDP